MINLFKKNILFFSITVLIMLNCVLANSRVAFSRPGNMMRIPNYAFYHENPYFFSISLSSEIVNFNSDSASEYGKSSNSAAIKMQTNSGFTFGLTAGNIMDPANVGELGFHMQKSMFKHGDVSLSMGIHDVLYTRDNNSGEEVMKIGDISFFGVLTNQKSFDNYRLFINVGAGSGKVKYDPHINSSEESYSSGMGLFLGFNLNTPYLLHNGGMELIAEYHGSGINIGTIIPFTNSYIIFCS